MNKLGEHSLYAAYLQGRLTKKRKLRLRCRQSFSEGMASDHRRFPKCDFRSRKLNPAFIKLWTITPIPSATFLENGLPLLTDFKQTYTQSRGTENMRRERVREKDWAHCIQTKDNYSYSS